MYLASGTWSLVIGSNLEEDVRDDLQSSISKYDAISNVMDILHERVSSILLEMRGKGKTDNHYCSSLITPSSHSSSVVVQMVLKTGRILAILSLHFPLGPVVLTKSIAQRYSLVAVSKSWNIMNRDS